LTEDETLDIPTSVGVLSKAQDPEGHLLTPILLNAPAHGVVVPEVDGAMVYIPAPGYSGLDTLFFSVSDGQLQSAPAAATFRVKKPSKTVVKSPQATIDRYSIQLGTVLNVPQPGLLRNDRDPQKDPLLVYLVELPAHGSLHLGIEGEFRYYPDANFQGRDSFTYAVYDGLTSSRPARVWLNVKASAKAPRTKASAFRKKPNETVLSVTAPGILKFATDPDGHFLTPFIVDYPTHGLLKMDQNGAFSYYPETGFKGIDTFTWKATDGLLDSNLGTAVLNCVSCNRNE
jgi:titin